MADILEFLPLPAEPGTTHAPASARHAAEMLDVRPLSVEECKALEPIFAERGVELPDPRWSAIIGCVTPDGKVTNNFLVVQLRIHAEPMYLADENLIHRIVTAAEEYIARKCGTVDVFLFAPAGHIARLAQLAGGMRVEPWVVLSKRVEGVAALDESSNLEQTHPDERTDPESESLTEKAVVTIQ